MKKLFTAIIIAVLTGLVVGITYLSANDQVPKMAPLAPLTVREVTEGRGFVAPRVDLSHLTGREMPSKSAGVVVPSRFDWREQGVVTSVKNQSLCGCCYAFASLGNIESKLLIDGASVYDFSENNAKECNWNQTSCDGGSYDQMANWYSQKGVVLESCDPYVAADVSCKSTCTYIKTLLDWRIITGNSVPNAAVLKQYIYDNGPVYTTMYAGGDGLDPSWTNTFNSYNGSYTLYYTGLYATNHAVLIVGWDDALVHAGGTGGWIVKNSWGTSWGGTCGYGTERGYFTIAYGSALIGSWSSYIDSWQDYNSGEKLLYYDEGGSNLYWGYNTKTAWGLCKFVPASSGYLTRVDFWTNDITTDIDIYIYDSFNGTNLGSLLVSKLNTSYAEAGYHSVALDSPPAITAGNDVYAVLKITNASYGFPVVCDGDGPHQTATTYMSSTGLSGSWYDLGVNGNCDAGIRIRTSANLPVSVDDNSMPVPDQYYLSNNYPNPFNPSTTINYSLPRRSDVRITIYNVLGEAVKSIVDEEKAAGEHSVVWDGTDNNGKQVASGLYLYQILTNNFVESKKMVLLK